MKKIYISIILLSILLIGASNEYYWILTDTYLTPISNVDIRTAENKELILTSPVWDDLRFPASSLNPPGGVSDADINATNGVLLFDDSSTEQIVGIAQMSHKWVSGTDLSPHIHWFFSDTDTGSVVWEFSYDYAYINSGFSGTYTKDTITVESPETANKHLINGFSDIATTEGGVSMILMFKIARLGGETEDTYTGDVSLLEFDIHYKIDRMGSINETSR